MVSVACMRLSNNIDRVSSSKINVNKNNAEHKSAGTNIYGFFCNVRVDVLLRKLNYWVLNLQGCCIAKNKNW